MKFVYPIFAYIVSTFVVATPALAQFGTGFSPGGSNRLQNPLRVDSLIGFLLAVIDILIVLAVPVIIFFIVYAGFKYVTAQGNPQGIQEANRALLYALIGGVIILGARAIGAIIQNTVGSITV